MIFLAFMVELLFTRKPALLFEPKTSDSRNQHATFSSAFVALGQGPQQ